MKLKQCVILISTLVTTALIIATGCTAESGKTEVPPPPSHSFFNDACNVVVTDQYCSFSYNRLGIYKIFFVSLAEHQRGQEDLPSDFIDTMKSKFDRNEKKVYGQGNYHKNFDYQIKIVFIPAHSEYSDSSITETFTVRVP